MSSHFPSLVACIAWALGLAAGIAGVVLLGRRRRASLGHPAAAPAYTGLSPKEQAIIAACADTLFPPGGPIPVSGTEAGIVRYIDRYLGGVPVGQRRLMRLLFQAVEHSPALFGPTRARFTRLSVAERVAVLEAMSRSRIYFRRVMFISLRLMLTMGYFANQEVARRIGVVFERAPFERARRPEREAAPTASDGDRADAGPTQEARA